MTTAQPVRERLGVTSSSAESQNSVKEKVSLEGSTITKTIGNTNTKIFSNHQVEANHS